MKKTTYFEYIEENIKKKIKNKDNENKKKY